MNLVDIFGAIGNWFADVGQGLDAFISGLLATVASIDPVWRTSLAGLAIFLETTVLLGLVIPGDTVVIVAATGVSNPTEFVALVLVAVLGALSGESVGFALGRFFGPRIRASRLGQKIGEQAWQRAENYVDRRGGIAVFVSRFLPVLHSLVPLTVGMSAMRYRKFMAWTTPACIIWAIVYVSFGTAAAGGYRELSERAHGVGYLFVAVVIGFALAVMATKRLLARSQSRHWERPGDGDAATRDEAEPRARRRIGFRRG